MAPEIDVLPPYPYYEGTGHICIEHAYLFSSFTRTIGFPTRELTIALGSNIVDYVNWVVLYDQEATAEVWYDGQWNFFDPFFMETGIQNMDDYFSYLPIIRVWRSFDRQDKHDFAINPITGRARILDIWSHLKDDYKPGVIIHLYSPATMEVIDANGRGIEQKFSSLTDPLKLHDPNTTIPGSSQLLAGSIGFSDPEDPNSSFELKERVFIPADFGSDLFTISVNGTDEGSYTIAAGTVFGNEEPQTFVWNTHSGQVDVIHLTRSDQSELVFTPRLLSVSAGGPYIVNEGGIVGLNGSGMNPEGEPVSYEWDIDQDGQYELSGQLVSFSAEYIDGPAIQTISLKVCTSSNVCATGDTTVSIYNVEPVVSPIVVDQSLVEYGNHVFTNVEFIDLGLEDTHTAIWDWGDGTTSVGSISDFLVSGSHNDEEPGVYTIKLTVSDDDGGGGNSIYQYVVVYEPDGGFVTGGGWFISPVGAYVSNPSLTGKATLALFPSIRKAQPCPPGTPSSSSMPETSISTQVITIGWW